MEIITSIAILILLIVGALKVFDWMIRGITKSVVDIILISAMKDEDRNE